MSDERSDGEGFDPSRTQRLPGGQPPPPQQPWPPQSTAPGGAQSSGTGGPAPAGPQPPQSTPPAGPQPPQGTPPDLGPTPLADPAAPNPPETPGWAALPGATQLGHPAASGPQPGARGAVIFVALVALVTLVALVLLIALLVRDGPSLFDFSFGSSDDPAELVFSSSGTVAAGQATRVDLPPLGPGLLRIDVLGQGGFDPVAQLLDSSGRQLAENDDVGLSRNSRVEVSTSTPTPLTVVVRGFDGAGGSFAIEVRLTAQT